MCFSYKFILLNFKYCVNIGNKITSCNFVSIRACFASSRSSWRTSCSPFGLLLSALPTIYIRPAISFPLELALQVLGAFGERRVRRLVCYCRHCRLSIYDLQFSFHFKCFARKRAKATMTTYS